MAGETKVLTYAEGVEVSAPAQSFLVASSLSTYASDADFVTAKGSVASTGDFYGNTTDGTIHYYDGTLWRSNLNAPNNFTAITDPTVDDDEGDGYKAGSFWVNTTSDVSYIAIDVSTGAAIWIELGKPIIGVREIPTGVINGINADFTITYTPIDDTLMVYRDGSLLPLDQFSYTHPIVTLDTAPSLGQKIEVAYLTNGSTATTQSNASNHVVDNHTLTSGEISAKQLTLPSTPTVPTRVIIDVRGGTCQVYGIDFTVSGDIVDWDGYALDGQISAGEILRIQYYV